MSLQNSTEGPCALHDQVLSTLEQHVGVFWAECIDSPFQQWQRGSQQRWLSAANGYCLSAETQSCLDLSSCTNTSAGVGNQHAVVAGPCDKTSSTAWQTNATAVATAVTLAADPEPPALLPPAPLSQVLLHLCVASSGELRVESRESARLALDPELQTLSASWFTLPFKFSEAVVLMNRHSSWARISWWRRGCQAASA